MSNWLCARCVSERHSTAIVSIDGSPIEQRRCKKVHWKKRESAGEVKRIGFTMVELSVMFLVASVSSLEENGTYICCVFLLWRPLPDSTSDATTIAISRSFARDNGTYWLQADRRVTVDDKSSANVSAGFSSVQMAPTQEVELRRHQTWQWLQRLEESHKRAAASS